MNTLRISAKQRVLMMRRFTLPSLILVLLLHSFTHAGEYSSNADSSFESRQRQFLYHRLASLGLNPRGDLAIYGENLFPQTSNRPLAIGQVLLPENYRLGPGDVVGVYLLGKAQRDFELTVLPEGRVYVPTAGLVEVAGLTMTQARERLREHMSRFFNTSEFDATLLNAKTVVVEVVGEVRRPGRHSLSGLHTVLDAIQLAGGVTYAGSLRNIMVENRAQKNVRADLYQTLLQPQSNETPLLQAGDRIFVPPAQRWIAVAGEVHRPAIFELRDDDSESLSSALALAGGTTSLADTLRLEWSRLLPGGRRETQVVNLAETHANGSFAPLRHGDRITVYSKLTQAEVPQVAVYGEVIAPGIYAYEENLRVSDLILRAGGLSRAAYLLEAELARIDPGQPPYREKIALHKILLSQTSDNASGKSADDALLRPDDQLFIRRIPDWRVGPLVEIRGEVKFPGMYAIDWGKTRLSEICQLAGGPTPEASLHEARLYRRRLEHAPLQTETTLPAEILTRFDHEKIKFDRDRQEASLISVDFAKLLLAHEAQHDVVLAPGDLIEFPRQSRLVYVTGAVGLPGGIPFVPGEKVSGYIARAGGFGLHASRSRVKVVRATGEIVNDEDAGPLAAGDTIWVPTRSERSSWNTLRDFVTVAAQLATIYVVIDRATGN